MTSYTDEEIAIAQVVHEANRALQYEQGDDAPSLPWECESDHIRAIALDGVRRARGGESAAQHHEAWCEFKRAAGWVYGPVKDAGAKPHPTHPCLVPYDELPRHQQVKDQVFLAVARAMAATTQGES